MLGINIACFSVVNCPTSDHLWELLASNRLQVGDTADILVECLSAMSHAGNEISTRHRLMKMRQEEQVSGFDNTVLSCSRA